MHSSPIVHIRNQRGTWKLRTNFTPLLYIQKVEKYVKTRIINFSDKRNIISDHQFDFRNKLSTTDEIYTFIKTVISHLDITEKV